MFSAESMSAIPALEELPMQPSLREATAWTHGYHKAPAERRSGGPTGRSGLLSGRGPAHTSEAENQA